MKNIKYLNNFRLILRQIPLLDRWIISKLLPILVFSISAFTTVSLSVGVMFDLIRKIVEFGLPIFVALKIFFLSLPGFLVLAFPMSVLLSCLLTYGKLSSNSEIIALKSLGIDNFRIVLPSLFLAVFMTLMTFVFNDNLVPISNRIGADFLDRRFPSIHIRRRPKTLWVRLPPKPSGAGSAARTPRDPWLHRGAPPLWLIQTNK